jgi:phosphate-selective porin OprO/OprP
MLCSRRFAGCAVIWAWLACGMFGGYQLHAQTSAETPLPGLIESVSFSSLPIPAENSLPKDDGERVDAVPIADPQAELEKMRAEMEARLKGLEEKFEERLAAEKAAKAEAKKKPSFKLGGRIHMDYWDFMSNTPGIGYFEHPDPTSPDFGDDPEDRFLFRRIRLEFGGDIPQNMEWRMQLDFNNPGIPEYKDMYFGWKNLPGNQTLLIGNQKRPLGLDHLNSSRYNIFAERPLVVESFNEDARRIGIAMYGYTDAEDAHWRYGLYNLENTAIDGRFIGDSLQMGGYGRLAFSPYYDEASGGRGYYHWAIAGVVAKPDGDRFANDTNSNEGRFRTRPEARSDTRWIDTGRIAGADWYETLAFESMLNLGPWQFTGEYMSTFMQRDNVTPGTGQDVNFHGFYVFAAYFLTGEHMAYSRKTGTLARAKPFENFFLVDRLTGGTGHGWGAWQVALRYDYMDLSDEDINGGVEQNYTLGANWYWNAYSKLQTNLIHGNITDRGPIGGFDSGSFWILGTRFMCDF